MQTKKGFTLIESLFTISLISVLLMMIAPMRRHIALEKVELKKLGIYIEQAHKTAVENARRVDIAFDGKSVSIGESDLYLSYCRTNNKSFAFLPNGNVTQSLTVKLNCENSSYDLVVHLGSGHIDLR